MSTQTQNGSARPPLTDLVQKHFGDHVRIILLNSCEMIWTTRWGKGMSYKPDVDSVQAKLEQNPETGNWQVIFAGFIQNYKQLPELLDEDIALLKLGADFRTVLNNRDLCVINQEKLRVTERNK